MPNNTEWLDSHSQTYFPFRKQPSSIPLDFIDDLRLFANAYKQIDAFISTVSYNSTADAYTIVISNSTGVILTGASISRLSTGLSRVHTKNTIGTGELVCLFVPGPSWDDPSWGGVGNWSISGTSTTFAIEPSNVLPGPKNFRRLLIDELSDPRLGVWPSSLVQTLVGGYNVRLSSGTRNSNTENTEPTIDIEAGEGLGLGYLPAEEGESHIATINGVAPDSNGNINLVASDCLTIFTPVVGNVPVANTQQIDSNCSPCCPCGSYRNMSAAISRRSQKINDLCNQLAATQADAIQAYLLAQDYKSNHPNDQTGPALITRDLVLERDSLSFTLQNKGSYEVYPYIAVSFLTTSAGTTAITTPAQTVSFPLGPNFRDTIDGDKTSLAPINDAGVGSAVFPTNATYESALVMARIGYPKQDGIFHTMPSGGSCLIKISTTNDLRVSGTQIKIRSVSLLGHTLKYGAKGHTMNAQVLGSGDTHVIALGA